MEEATEDVHWCMKVYQSVGVPLEQLLTMQPESWHG